VIGADWDVSAALERVRERIADAAVRAGRDPADITLVGVSKTRSAEEVVAAIRAGLRHVGENRVQEAAVKLPVVRQLLAAQGGLPASPHAPATDPRLGTEAPRGNSVLSTQHSVLSTQYSVLSTQHTVLTFHMVGHLQSNKAGSAVGLFDRVDSIDSLKVAQALSRRLNGAEDLPVLLEVYVGDDPSRPGLRPEAVVDQAGKILEVPGLRVDGLMTVAPLDSDACAAFRQVYDLKLTLARAFPRVHFGVLSMGMSEDYLQAIEEGSTEVRIGTALFGPRQPRY
jgi:pyridoxal phosphate enzyme (YggS family)